MMRTLLTLLFTLALGACQTSNVMVDYDTQADFSGIKTYAWLDKTSGAEEGYDPLLAKRVRAAVETGLKGVPLLPARNPASADILVRYYLGSYTSSKQSNSRGSIGLGSGGGHSFLGLSMSFPLGGERIVKEAQIIVDFINPADQKLRWRGTNLIEIGDDSPTAITAKINAAVAEIFARFPPEKSPE